jgi:hypothetical protein
MVEYLMFSIGSIVLPIVVMFGGAIVYDTVIQITKK